MKSKIRDILHRGLSEEQRLYPRIYARRAKKYIDRFVKDMGNEANESVDMANSFFRLLHHKLKLSDRDTPPSKEEVKAAIEQLKDIGRFSVFITAVIIPAGVLSLVGLELLARKYGIKNFNILPSSFRRNKENENGKSEDNNG